MTDQSPTGNRTRRCRVGDSEMASVRRSVGTTSERINPTTAPLRSGLRLLVVSNRRRFSDVVVPALASDTRVDVIAIVRDVGDAAVVARTSRPDLMLIDAASRHAAEAVSVCGDGPRAIPTLVMGKPQHRLLLAGGGTTFIADSYPLDVLARWFFTIASLAAALRPEPSPQDN